MPFLQIGRAGMNIERMQPTKMEEGKREVGSEDDDSVMQEEEEHEEEAEEEEEEGEAEKEEEEETREEAGKEEEAPEEKQECHTIEYDPSRGKLKMNKGGFVKEQHNLPIYAVAWSTDIFSRNEDESSPGRKATPRRKNKSRRYYRCFASVAGANVTVYEVEIPDPAKAWTHTSRTGKFILKQSYYVPEPEESLYACAFGGRSFGTLGPSPTSPPRLKKVKLEEKNAEGDDEPLIPVSEVNFEEEEPKGPQFLCVGGKSFSIKVIDTARRQLWMTLSGHGEEITILKFSPTDCHMLLSASNDRSCRIWNVRTGTCIAILAGHEGHKDIVMSANWHVLGHKIVSGSHDTLVKIWNVGEGTKIHNAMKESYKVPLQIHKNNVTVEARDHFDPVICQFPIFSTHKVHFHPVDCVEFLGDLVISKAANNMVLWDPDYSNPDGNPNVTVPPPDRVTALKTMTIKGAPADVMFYRFSSSPDARFVAVGNTLSQLLMYDVDDFKGSRDKKMELNSKLERIVRMTAFSPDGRILLACCDDGTIWKYDVAKT